MRLIQQECDEIMSGYRLHMQAYEERLKKEHPIKSLVDDWLNERLDLERVRSHFKNH